MHDDAIRLIAAWLPDHDRIRLMHRHRSPTLREALLAGGPWHLDHPTKFIELNLLGLLERVAPRAATLLLSSATAAYVPACPMPRLATLVVADTVGWITGERWRASPLDAPNLRAVRFEASASSWVINGHIELTVPPNVLEVTCHVPDYAAVSVAQPSGNTVRRLTVRGRNVWPIWNRLPDTLVEVDVEAFVSLLPVTGGMPECLPALRTIRALADPAYIRPSRAKFILERYAAHNIRIIAPNAPSGVAGAGAALVQR